MDAPTEILPMVYNPFGSINVFSDRNSVKINKQHKGTQLPWQLLSEFRGLFCMMISILFNHVLSIVLLNHFIFMSTRGNIYN